MNNQDGKDRASRSSSGSRRGDLAYRLLEIPLLLAERWGSGGDYDQLDPENRRKLAPLCGKDEHGNPLNGHLHAYFLLWPDEDGNPTRLVVWREKPFEPKEIEALLKALERPIRWEPAARKWGIRLLPLPFEISLLKGMFDEARVWRSVTPFVPPAERHRFRKSRRERPSETVEKFVEKLANNRSPVARVEKICEPIWVNLHEARERRRARKETGTPWMRPGYMVCVEFRKSIMGPLIIGDSCHFGLGLFVAERERWRLS